jgi:flagellar biosynthetic protein FliO
MTGGGIEATIVLIVLMLLVIFAAYFTTKFLSSKARGITKTKYIQVKDRMFIGRDRHILLIEVGSEAFLVGVTNQEINVLGTIKKDKLVPLTEEQSVSVISGLKGFMGKMAGMVKNAGSAPEDLRKARMQYKQEKKPENAPEKPAEKKKAPAQEEDDIQKMIEALNRRKSRYTETSQGDDKGDNK